MPDTRENRGATRRALLLAGLGAPAAMAAVATGGEAAPAAETDDRDSPTMRETEHTRAYFESARF